VVNAAEARAIADDNPLSFLRVSRAELEFAADVDPYSPAVYERAAANFAALRKSALVEDETPAVYLYRLRAGSHEQTGIAACFSLDEYDRDVIKKHERTRHDKEEDRTRHMLALRAQTGPVFLVYRRRDDADRIVEGAMKSDPLIDFEAPDGVRHTLWRLVADERDELLEMAERIPALYIADGHHRAASAARARTELQAAQQGGVSRDPMDADHTTFLGVAFPDNQVQILPYNRIVKDLGGLSADAFRRAIAERFDVVARQPTPSRRGEISMYFEREWQLLHPRAAATSALSLDVTLLQDQLLGPVLNVVDVRTDPRIDFVGGARGTAELERLVDSGRAAVAFSLLPVRMNDVMMVSDAGGIMPPKSTWFEPKLRDGLLIHVI
jgi:uncharacterized protein (DUF1015 family)